MLIKQIFAFTVWIYVYPENSNQDLDYMISKGIRQSQSILNARLSIQSSELGPPAPSQESVVSPIWVQGRDGLPCGGGGGGPNSDDGTDTLVL